MGILDTPALSPQAAAKKYDKRLADVGLLPAPAIGSHPFVLTTTQTDAGQYQRSKHKTYMAVTEVRFVFGNYRIAFGDTDVPNNIQVKASVEAPLGTYFPIHFPGEDANGYVTLRPGKFVVSDPIAVSWPDATNFWVNTLVVPTAGGSYPVGGSLSTGTGSSEWRIPNTTTDYTITAPSGTNTAGPGFGPLAIIGRSVTPKPCVFSIGDSIMAASGDTSNYTAWGLGENGWFRRGLNNQTPYVFMARSSTLAKDLPGIGGRYTLQMASRSTHAVVGFGANDLTAPRTLAQIQADLTTIWQSLADRGIKVYQTTITPNVSSTDSYATLVNQTPVASNDVRIQLNDWIRTTPAPLTGYIETADTVESERNSGKWKVNGAANYATADGLHPSAAGHLLMAAAVPTFTL